jgi:hypothetical protein
MSPSDKPPLSPIDSANPTRSSKLIEILGTVLRAVGLHLWISLTTTLWLNTIYHLLAELESPIISKEQLGFSQVTYRKVFFEI